MVEPEHSLFPQMRDDARQSAVFSNQLQRRFGPNAPDGLEVVAAEQDAQVDELSRSRQLKRWPRGAERAQITMPMSMSRPSSARWRLTSMMGAFFASLKVRCR